MKTNVGGVWKPAKPFVNVGGVWKPVEKAWVREAGLWREAYAGAVTVAAWAGQSDYAQVEAYGQQYWGNAHLLAGPPDGMAATTLTLDYLDPDEEAYGVGPIRAWDFGFNVPAYAQVTGIRFLLYADGYYYPPYWRSVRIGADGYWNRYGPKDINYSARVDRPLALSNPNHVSVWPAPGVGNPFTGAITAPCALTPALINSLHVALTFYATQPNTYGQMNLRLYGLQVEVTYTSG